MPVPALVKVTSVPLMMPVTEATPLLVIDKALLVDKVMAAAVNVPVFKVRPVNAVPPTVPVNVISPPVVMLNVLAPSTVELNDTFPDALLVKVMFAPSVIALPKLISPVVAIEPPDNVMPAVPTEALVVKLAKELVYPSLLDSVMPPVLVVVRVSA